MPNTYFQFQQFRVSQKQSGMKVTTDGCLFGAWVANQLKKRPSEPKRILDIGTGTGLLSLMVAQATSESRIDAVELNERAYDEAIQNFLYSPWSSRLHGHYGSIQGYDPSHPTDVILCNPPFFQKSQKGKQSDRNEAIHSDRLPMGDLMVSIQKHLSKTGKCYLLFPEKEMDELISRAKNHRLYPSIKIVVKNQDNHPVFRVMACFEFGDAKTESSEIVIRRNDGKYTREFWELLKEYYLEYNDPDFKEDYFGSSDIT